MAAQATIVLGLALVVALVAAGCGGGADGSSDSGYLARAELIRKADAACRKVRIGLAKRSAALLERERSHGYPHDLVLWRVAHYLWLPVIEDEIIRIRSLAISPADRPGVEAALSAESSAIGNVTTAGRVASMGAFRHYFVESGIELRANGLDSCANDRGRRS